MPTPAVPQIVRLPAALAALVAGPDLGGRAACRGRAPDFDVEVHARLELGRRAVGVWAGAVHLPPPDPRRTRRSA